MISIVGLTSNAKEAIERGKLEECLKERRDRIKRDVNRYWRIKESKGDTFLAYIDPLEILYRYDLVESFKTLGDDAFATMGILSVIRFRMD